jgi:anti-sigma factor RsiW
MSPRIPDTHAEAWALLPWLANGRLGAEDREWVEAHVAGCAECRAELASQRLVASRMSADLEQPVGDDVEQKSFNKLWARRRRGLARVAHHPLARGGGGRAGPRPRSARLRLDARRCRGEG